VKGNEAIRVYAAAARSQGRAVALERHVAAATMGMRGRVAAHPPNAFPRVQVRRRSVGYLFVRSFVHSFIRSFDRSIGREVGSGHRLTGWLAGWLASERPPCHFVRVDGWRFGSGTWLA
jgi:hypothetical protein